MEEEEEDGGDGSVLFIRHELAGSRVQGGEKEEGDAEQNEGLELVDGNARLDVELRESSLPRYYLSDDGEGDPQLGQSANEELVCLRESEKRATLAEAQSRPQAFSRGDDGPLQTSRRIVDEPASVTQSADGAEESEEDEEEEERLGLVDRDPRLQVQLG